MDALQHGRVTLQPLASLDNKAWRKLQSHFRDPEIAHLNGTPPNREPLWLLRRILKADARRKDRATFGIFDECSDYIGTCELYDIRRDQATMGIIIGEKTHWNQGYGPEAMHALLDHAFHDLGLQRIVLNTYGDNTRAQRAFAKVGFRETGRTTGPDGRLDVHMELRRETWRERRLAEQHRDASSATPA